MAPLEINPYERVARQPQQSGGLPWRLFSFAFFLLIVACGVYLGLKFGYAPILSNRIEQLDRDLATLSEQIPEEQQKGFIQLYSQIVNLQSVLQKHVMVSVIFPILEKNTHTEVSYSNFDLNILENRLSLEGFARSYAVLAQQLEAWTNVAQVEKSYVAESQLTEGRVRFRMVLQFSPSLFKPNNRLTATP
ncbi:MAG: hypothetical protein Q7R62_00165 [bacterium]|nr:hypothetical protein [bacterium]